MKMMAKTFKALTDFMVLGAGFFKAGEIYPVGELPLEKLEGFAVEIPVKKAAKETPPVELGEE